MTSPSAPSLTEKLLLIKRYKRLALYPILAFVITALLIGIVLHPLIQLEQHLEQLTWQQNTTIIITFLVYFYLVNLVLCFFNVATLASVSLAIQNHRNVRLSDGFYHAYQRSLAIWIWTSITTTLGIVIRLIEGWSDHWNHYRGVQKYLSGLDWQTATYFVPTLIACNNTSITHTLIQSSQVAQRLGGKPGIHRLKKALPALLKPIACIPMLLGFYWMAKTAIIVGGVISIVLLLLITVLNALIRNLMATQAYLK